MSENTKKNESTRKPSASGGMTGEGTDRKVNTKRRDFVEWQILIKYDEETGATHFDFPNGSPPWPVCYGMCKFVLSSLNYTVLSTLRHLSGMSDEEKVELGRATEERDYTD